jgi:hypothetical protein
MTEGGDEQHSAPANELTEQSAKDPWVPFPTRLKWRRLRHEGREQSQEPFAGRGAQETKPEEGD